jgi:hypothetical protein
MLQNQSQLNLEIMERAMEVHLRTIMNKILSKKQQKLIKKIKEQRVKF